MSGQANDTLISEFLRRARGLTPTRIHQGGTDHKDMFPFIKRSLGFLLQMEMDPKLIKTDPTSRGRRSEGEKEEVWLLLSSRVVLSPPRAPGPANADGASAGF